MSAWVDHNTSYTTESLESAWERVTSTKELWNYKTVTGWSCRWIQSRQSLVQATLETDFSAEVVENTTPWKEMELSVPWESQVRWELGQVCLMGNTGNKRFAINQCSYIGGPCDLCLKPCSRTYSLHPVGASAKVRNLTTRFCFPTLLEVKQIGSSHSSSRSSTKGTTGMQMCSAPSSSLL